MSSSKPIQLRTLRKQNHTYAALGTNDGEGDDLPADMSSRKRRGRYLDVPTDEDENGAGEEGVNEESVRLLDRVEGGDVEDQPPPQSVKLKQTRRPRSTKALSTSPRTIEFPPSSSSQQPKYNYSPNISTHTKYTALTFLPLTLYTQFKFFFNLYFLLVALSQFVPQLRIGYLSTYVLPLVFVMGVTMGKEALDDLTRRKRDAEVNREGVEVVVWGADNEGGLQTKIVQSSQIKVGDLILLTKDKRVPADCVLLRTFSDKQEDGTLFIRTAQLDGETDWKVRVAPSITQSLSLGQLVGSEEIYGEVYVDPPIKDIHSFIGKVTVSNSASESQQKTPTTHPLTISNTLWASTVLASSVSALCLVVYTGRDTRAVMNTNTPKTKWGALEVEINALAKILCTSTLLLSLLLVGLNSFRGEWPIYTFRFLILFSSIIPISLRVNLDMSKTVYARSIQSDPAIPGAIVRTSTLPEELGRVEYVLSDKTGTLTRNEMELKKLHMGTISFGGEAMDEVAVQLGLAYGVGAGQRARAGTQTGIQLATRGRRDISSRVSAVVLALATCHNVTPSNESGEENYQASSPDEIAIVKWTASVGLKLLNRDRNTMTLIDPTGSTRTYTILDTFPFTSETKRMGIIVQEKGSEEIYFYLKGADTVIAPLVQLRGNEWLEEECNNMAREGLRTLVVCRRILSQDQYRAFKEAYYAASLSLTAPSDMMARAISQHLEQPQSQSMELLGITGVEDRLQEDVRQTIELIRNAGIKVWMLTGDKVETATCIAISTKMVKRGESIKVLAKLRTDEEVKDSLDSLQSQTQAGSGMESCLVIDGDSLQIILAHHLPQFIEIATSPSIASLVACRCSPTQKAELAKLIRKYTGKRVCCIGDGGNDVSMIQEADVGIGLVGKEGRQASLAADFSLNQFSHLTKLLLWHGRNSYKRSAKLSQFVIHRGLIISVMQAVFSAIFYFAPIALYQGWLMVGYATVYTMAPVFSLVLDRDVNEEVALLYPELYKELRKGRSLSYKTFFEWTMISLYQGSAIMIMSLILFENEFLNIVAISFTALVLNELIMVALEITIWHKYMIIAELVTLFLYVISMWFLPEYFDLSLVLSTRFAWKVAVIVAVSSLPLYIVKLVKGIVAPAATSKLL